MYIAAIAENRNEKGKAEDAYPLAGDNFVIVADGLGSGIKHTKPFTNIKNITEFFNIAFKGVLEDTDENRKLVLKNFDSLDFNADKVSSAKFASGLVALTVYDVFMKNEKMKRFLKTPIVDGNIESFTTELGKILEDAIKINLKQFKENLGLKDENPQMVQDRNNFLPSTLACCICEEKDDSIDSLVFWAGDSRVYILNDDGLIPVTEDEEEFSGGALSNIIQLLREFHIKCNYQQFKKPVVLIAVTDGVFDKKGYGRAETKERCLIPMEFEQEILSLFLNSGSIKEFGENAKNYYEQNLVGDDSASLAVSAFGFETYCKIQEMCQDRKIFIDDALTVLCGGYDEEYYEKGKAELNEEYKKILSGLKSKLSDELKSKILAMVRRHINEKLANNSPLISDEEITNIQKELLKEIEERLKNRQDEIINTRKKIKEVLSCNWLFFRNIFTTEKIPKCLGVFDSEKQFQKISLKKDEYFSRHFMQADNHSKTVITVVGTIQSGIDQIRNFQLDENDTKLYKELRQAINDVFDYIDASINGNNKTINMINKLNEDLTGISMRIWKQEEKKFPAVNGLLNGNINSLNGQPECDNITEIRTLAQKITILNSEIEKIKTSKTDIANEIAVKLFEKYSDKIFESALNNHGNYLKLEIPPDDVSKYDILKRKMKDYEQQFEKIKQYYNRYCESYRKYCRGDLDV